jgi:hypothetical protein
MLVVGNGAEEDRSVLVAIAGALGFELVRSGERARRTARGGTDQPRSGVSLGGLPSKAIGGLMWQAHDGAASAEPPPMLSGGQNP